MPFNRLHVLIFCAFLVLVGMIGLYLHIEHSGWALGIGLLGGLMNFEKDDSDG